MNTTQSLHGKTAIITGGGTGIGRGIALALAREGVNVVICGRRQARLDTTLNLIQDSGGRGLTVQADISEVEPVKQVVEAALAEYSQIDILINNAGIYAESDLHNLGVDAWDQMMKTNLRGPFLTVRQVLPHMRAQKGGHIINISSESGIEYYPQDTAYGVSKHALNDLGEYIQRENQDHNIRVDTICPGMVVTEMTENDPGLDHSKCLYPEDIADLALWLLSRRPNIKIATPIMIQTMLNPWEAE